MIGKVGGTKVSRKPYGNGEMPIVSPDGFHEAQFQNRLVEFRIQYLIEALQNEFSIRNRSVGGLLPTFHVKLKSVPTRDRDRGVPPD